MREAAVLALRHACFTDVAEVEKGKNTDNLQVMVTAEDFNGAFANITPSVSEGDREQYQELSTRFGWRKPVAAK